MIPDEMHPMDLSSPWPCPASAPIALPAGLGYAGLTGLYMFKKKH